ncbi:MAG: hypothetical protein ACTSP2_07140, partial [Alphaproteobacteria bacterium]
TVLETRTEALAALEARVSDLTSDAADLNPPAQSLALLLFDQMARSSAPFTVAVDAVAGFVGSETELATLRPLAASGVPSRRQLADDFAVLAPTLALSLAPALAEPAADAVTSESPAAGDEGGLLGWLNRIVSIRRTDAPAPAVAEIDTTADALATAMAAGDLAAALSEQAKLPEAARAASADWAAAVANRLTVDALVAAIIADARPAQN